MNVKITSAEIFSISFSFTSIEEEISACTPGKKYDENFLKTERKWKNFIIKQYLSFKESPVFCSPISCCLPLNLGEGLQVPLICNKIIFIDQWSFLSLGSLTPPNSGEAGNLLRKIKFLSKLLHRVEGKFFSSKILHRIYGLPDTHPWNSV